MATREIPGIGTCEIIRPYARNLSVFHATLPCGSVMELTVGDSGSVYARNISGNAVAWLVGVHFEAHLRAKFNLPTPAPVAADPAFEAAMSADQDATNAHRLRRMGFRVAA